MKFAEIVALVWVFILVFVFMILKIGKKKVPPVYSSVDYFRRGVKVAGGEYVGIQECDVDHSLDCVLFNSPLTGSTLAVKVENFSEESVIARLEEHHHQKDAAKAYDTAALQYHGEFAKTNKMLGLID